MDINKFICFITLASSVLAGCSQEEAVSPEGDVFIPIRLSAEIATSTEVKAKDTGVDFPNKGKITVIAAKHTAGTTNWNDLHLDNKPAVTTSKGSVYDFNWSPEGSGLTAPKYYWPFNPDENLVFVAFNPTTLSYTQHSKTSLDIELKEKMEDMIYTKPTAPKNREAGQTVDLGQFQHALAKVRIIVKAIDKKGNAVSTEQFKVKEIKVKTKVTTATFDLTDSKLTTLTGTEYKMFTLLNTLTPLKDVNGIKVEQNILPGNEEITYIGLTLTDGILEYGKNENDPKHPKFGYTLSEFTQEGDAKLAFEAGKITILTFNVQVTDVSTGDGDDKTIILKGDLKDWECQGNFEVGIE